MAYTVSTHRSQIPRSGMALGGIGTGFLEIRQDGGFHEWQIFNNWPLFTGERFPYDAKSSLFFLLWLRVEHENPRLVLLQLEESHRSAAIEGHEFPYIFPWLSGVDVIRYHASVPFADLEFEQEGLPLRVRLRAWSPFIPGNVKDSNLPFACFDFELEAMGERAVEVQLLASMRNMVGYDQPERIYAHKRVRDGDFSAVLFENDQLDPAAPTTGTMALASLAEDSTAYLGWEHHHPYYERLLREYPLPEYDDTEGRNNVDSESGRKRADPRCFATIGKAARLAQRGERLRHSFLLAWHFPNLYGRPPRNDPHYRRDEPHGHDEFEGHSYAVAFASAEAVARYTRDHLDRLRGESEAFHRAFFDSDLSGEILDQVNSQLNTFRTSTWLTRSGLFGVIEGLSPQKPFAGLATTDVAMYGQIATSLLFPELDRLTVNCWRNLQRDNGIVAHSIPCNSRQCDDNEIDGHRLDLPAQFVFQSLRAALWSGDPDWLREVWPDCKRALAYVLRERDANGDGLPDMEGVMCSYDNFPMYGVAPYVVTQWLAALALALKVARMLEDKAFLGEYTDKFRSGCATLAEKTWNGRYFSLYSDFRESDPGGRDGCMTDQLIGEGVAQQLGLPALLEETKVRGALRSIYAMNYKPEQGLRNCQWPGDAFLHDIDKDTWVDQANTCWTGVEFNFAAQLYAHGMVEKAEAIVHNIDARYRKWGLYFDHQEFGGHYFRPMSALAVPNAYLGLSYDGETLRIRPAGSEPGETARPLPAGRWCFLFPGGYGTLFHSPEETRLVVRSGRLEARVIEIHLPGPASLENVPGDWTAEAEPDRTRFVRGDPGRTV